MRLFGWLRPVRDTKDTPPPWWERVAKLESDMKAIRLEWEETYESVNRAVRKLGRREQRALQEETVETHAETGPAPQTKDDLRRWAQANGRL